MITTISVLCYKSKTLSNGEHPLMLCISKDRVRKYKSLNISVKAEHWNFNKNEPKPNCPNKEYINILIANKKKEYETEIIKLKSEDTPFTANSLSDSISNTIKSKTVENAFKEYIQLLNDENRRGYMLSVKQVYNSLINHASDHASDHASVQVEKLVSILTGEMGRSELQGLLSIKNRDYFRTDYLNPAISNGYIELTIPDKPNSQNQKYRLTAKGIALKNSLTNNK